MDEIILAYFYDIGNNYFIIRNLHNRRSRWPTWEITENSTIQKGVKQRTIAASFCNGSGGSRIYNKRGDFKMVKWMQKSKLFLLIAAFCLMLVGCGQSGTAEPNQPTDQNQATAPSGEQSGGEKKKIVIGTDTNFVPFEFLNEATGEYDGFDIDLVKALAEEIGFAYELKPMDFNGLIPALQTQNIDMAVAGMTITDERSKVIDFSIPYYNAGLLIMVRQEEEAIKGLDDLQGKVIATKQGTSSYDFASKIEGVKEVIPFPNIDQAYMELEKGSADAVIFDSPNILYYIQTKGKDKVKTVGNLLEGAQFGFGFPKGSELRAEVDEALKKFLGDGTYDALYEKWFGTAPTQ